MTWSDTVLGILQDNILRLVFHVLDSA